MISLKHSPAWSVVIITLNEEENITRCLQSVFEAFRGYSFDIVLVDSASTDRTVEIASSFDVEIERLTTDAPRRPSAGRYLGTALTQGARILFLDGDCAIHAGWLAECDVAFDNDPYLAGVAGELIHELSDANGVAQSYAQRFPEDEYDEADHLAGSAAYRRDALDRVGQFNPYLRACEEAEVGARLRVAGYRLRRLRSEMVRHYPKYPTETVPELVRRLRRGYFTGIGQFARACVAHALPTKILWRTLHRYTEFFGLLSVGGIAIIMSTYYQTFAPLFMWLMLMAALFAVFSLRTHTWRKPMYYFLEWTLAVPCILWGFAQRPRSVHEFPRWRDS